MCAALVAAALSCTSPARADAPPASSPGPGAGGERLRTILDLAGSDARSDRIGHAIFDAIMVAAYVPAGAVLVTRSDPGVRAVGVAALAHGGVDLLDLSFAAFGSPLEYLRSELEERLARGVPVAEADAQTERDWQAAIRSAHRMATWNAVVDFVLGSAETALGLYWLLAPPGPGFDRATQTTWGTVLLGLGLPGLGFGFNEVLTVPPVERWWRVYRRLDASPAPRVSFSAGPVAGGAVGSIQLRW